MSLEWGTETEMPEMLHGLRFFMRLSGDLKCSNTKASRRAFRARPCLIICNVSQIMQCHRGSQSLEPVKCCVSQKALPIALALIFSICIRVSASKILAAFHA